LNYYTTTDEADQLSKTPVSIYSVVVVAMVIIDVFLELEQHAPREVDIF
jgi:hypothetical protein